MKTKKLLLVFGVCLMMAFAFVGCGSDDSASDSDSSSDVTFADDVVGDWTLATIVDSDGEEYTLQEYAEAQGVDASGIEATYTFSDDGTGSADIGGISTPISYEITDDVMTLTVDESGESSELYWGGEGVMYAEDADTGMQSYFEKQ